MSGLNPVGPKASEFTFQIHNKQLDLKTIRKVEKGLGYLAIQTFRESILRALPEIAFGHHNVTIVCANKDNVYAIVDGGEKHKINSMYFKSFSKVAGQNEQEEKPVVTRNIGKDFLKKLDAAI